ncbi:MAG TPA: hypothetical protein VGD63_22340 [Steroidobacteraceae bacterium]
MKDRMLWVMGAALTCASLAGCGGNDNPGAPPVTMTPPPPMTKDLDTAAVLAIVRTQTSETTDPFEVDNGVIAVTPVGDETSSPIDVNTT